MSIWSALAGKDNPANRTQPRITARPGHAAQAARRGGNAIVATSRTTGNTSGRAKAR